MIQHIGTHPVYAGDAAALRYKQVPTVSKNAKRRKRMVLRDVSETIPRAGMAIMARFSTEPSGRGSATP